MMGEIESGGIAEVRRGEEGGVGGRNKMREFEHIVRVDGFQVAEGSDPKESYGDGHADVVEDCANSLVRRSSTVENVLSSPLRVLEHCNTAPVRTHNDLRTESHEVKFSRSKTEKETPKHELKLDKLSDREKKKIIANLVKIQNDGTVEVDVDRSAPVASELLELDFADAAPTDIKDTTLELSKSVPKMRIAILVVGTRGDVQPFLAMAKRLQACLERPTKANLNLVATKEFGHSVRLATHFNFRTFVKSAGIDFYPLGGDPRVLAGYMARNKGFLPSAPGEISIQRKELKAIIDSLLAACTEPNLGTGTPFRAQSIIANPPSYGKSLFFSSAKRLCKLFQLK
ncbi:hypothetical protein GIB67_029236 [Kingdonia uniflora]|uniref:Glycosyltransferase family 28 N-terminal domain-containing protein n=1 Tax=Kingdonia uniflora TaxID=39325 RepID=A0A7J7N8C0_9MAGN|nr:hypothetical protein GIB67_029236 [Kingdonia uniflora]